MTRRRAVLIVLEAVLSGAAVALAAVTLLSPSWIEAAFRWDPDHGNGVAERAIAASFAALGLLLGWAARRHSTRWPQPHTA
jgi:hypothetical protein